MIAHKEVRTVVMPYESVTATRLTPPGRGAVATVAVIGPQASQLVGTLFTPAAGRSLSDFPMRRIIFGRWFSPTGVGEELVVCRMTEDCVEIHCHGGRAAVQAILASLVQAGAVERTPQQWLRDQYSDPIQAEALQALATAQTERTALLLLDQYQGAISRELAAIEKLRQTSPELARQRKQQLLQTYTVGAHVTTPWKVALVGKPNVGKSSLMNALLGYQRSLVFNLPGTTRDAVRTHTAFEGWPVELIDTAGIRAAESAVESPGVQVTERVLAEADLLLLVHDATQTEQEEELHDIPQQKTLVVRNKIDLCVSSETESNNLQVSAHTGQGLNELIAAIVQRLVPHPPQRHAAVLFTPRQVAEIALE